MLRVFHKSELLRAMNCMTVPALLGPLLGPFVGGAITTDVHGFRNCTQCVGITDVCRMGASACSI